MSTEDRPRVIVTLTETAPIEALWRVTTRWLTEPETEIVTLYLSDDRWRRAASLPFTREISRIGGPAATFTMRRAEQLHEAAIKRAREHMQQLASDANLRLIFEILTESDQHRLRDIVGERASVIVAPTLISQQPIFVHLSQFNCRLELVGESDSVTL